ncbi:equilibrative nucleoside transporter 3 isoform X2 [Anoplophora glabripennis]|uniref:equilibrative nucleoside transporter 3 isoform X2 n=1 Tax=Anoplophora glabripennis TaxID=217634 RepID=UPI0008743755|nr:equilibrative nucleoside transporter 3 isoform X2 [Anoplophora glabripennis]
MATNDVEETEQIIPNEEVEKVNEPVSYLFIVLFYFLGATCFIPNNFYVTANEYWMFKFRDPHIPFNNSDTQKTTLQKKFTAYTNMVGSIGMILFLFITFAISKKVSLQKRIVGGMFLLLVLFCITLLFVFVNTDSWQIGFFVIAVGISGLFSASTAVLLISLFQLSARFPPRCMAAQLAGQSVCGILSASIQVLTLLAAPTVKGTAGLYYAIATGVITATTIAYLTVSKKSEYLQNKLENDPEEEEEEEGEETSSKKFDIVKIKRVLRKLALILVSLTLCGVITQLLHPGLTALIESSGKGTNVWSDSYFLPVCVFLLFNTMEFIGRELSNHIQLIWLTAVVFCCDSVVRETDKLLMNCYMLEQTLPLRSKELEELDSLKELIKNKRPTLTAAGFFEIRRSTLLSLLSSTTTYFIVALQFNSL